MMDKVEVLRAAGLSCGDGCLCVHSLADSLSDNQVAAIGHVLKSREAKKAEELNVALGNGQASEPDIDDMIFGGMPGMGRRPGADGPSREDVLGALFFSVLGRGVGGRGPMGGGPFGFDR